MREALLLDEVLVHTVLALAAYDVLIAFDELFFRHLRMVAALLQDTDVSPLAAPNFFLDVVAVVQRIKIALKVRRGEVACEDLTLMRGKTLFRKVERPDERHERFVLQDDRLRRVEQKKLASPV